MADCGAAGTRPAIAAAEDAFWRFRPAGGRRAAPLERWYDLMLEGPEDPPAS